MIADKGPRSWKLRVTLALFTLCCSFTSLALCRDLPEIRKHGVLRHLGITYANFVRETEYGFDGLDVELVRLFAEYLGVRYQLVHTSWSDAIGDLTGNAVTAVGNDAVVTGTTTVKGDILANGLTQLTWREEVVDFSVPTFPTGVWLVARADSPIRPIVPSGELETDINRVRSLLRGHSVLGMKGTCIDPDLYNLEETGVEIRLFTASQSLNDIAPAIMQGMAETTLLDVPDALVALQKWPGEIKVIGPIIGSQLMGAAFAKTSPELKEEFNKFFDKCWKDGTYERLVRKYYPLVFLYLGDFFNLKR